MCSIALLKNKNTSATTNLESFENSRAVALRDPKLNASHKPSFGMRNNKSTSLITRANRHNYGYTNQDYY